MQYFVERSKHHSLSISWKEGIWYRKTCFGRTSNNDRNIALQKKISFSNHDESSVKNHPALIVDGIGLTQRNECSCIYGPSTYLKIFLDKLFYINSLNILTPQTVGKFTYFK